MGDEDARDLLGGKKRGGKLRAAIAKLKKLPKGAKRKALASLFIPIPGARAMAARRLAKRAGIKAGKGGKIAARAGAIAAAAGIPGGGTVALMVAAFRRRKAKKAAEKKRAAAKAAAAGLQVTPAPLASPPAPMFRIAAPPAGGSPLPASVMVPEPIDLTPDDSPADVGPDEAIEDTGEAPEDEGGGEAPEDEGGGEADEAPQDAGEALEGFGFAGSSRRRKFRRPRRRGVAVGRLLRPRLRWRKGAA